MYVLKKKCKLLPILFCFKNTITYIHVALEHNHPKPIINFLQGLHIQILLTKFYGHSLVEEGKLNLIAFRPTKSSQDLILNEIGRRQPLKMVIACNRLLFPLGGTGRRLARKEGGYLLSVISNIVLQKAIGLVLLILND